MCGIVGILGKKAVAGDLVDALRRLEYRGYDSAGVATVEDGHLDRRRAEGKLKNLEIRLSNHPLQGRTGLGHTRWATHGKPVERNAHPHMNERVAVVHNGIIENFQELRGELSAKGHVFQTETDTETVLHLVSDYLDQGVAPVDAARAALQRLQGAFALAVIFAGEDNLMIGTDYSHADHIEFDGGVFHNLHQVQAASHQVGNDTVITLDANNSITLHNVLMANLHAGDFTFG